MASKRKSTVPCMIPSRSKHVREDIILGCLPELLPTIPEDSILSMSGDESRHFSQKHPQSLSRGGTGGGQEAGTYACPACRFESRDLNYFLDHVHSHHGDFRARPTFHCLQCGVSVVRFEALALHNAEAHPGVAQGSVGSCLRVGRRDGLTAVEQSLFTSAGGDSGERDQRESGGISLTKTPIAKITRAKGEHKKIVVSHTVEVRKVDADPSVLTNVPEIQNGKTPCTPGAPGPMPRTAVTRVTAKTASHPVLHQHAPSPYPSRSFEPGRDLPKVMIPLSSIPTYDAAMDTSSFLKTSFGKFPYPTKAELCYLTVVSEFPEEQIKLWFTAQRLKQGISWSPEEIEDARRKMFNTIFQDGSAPQKQPSAQQRHPGHAMSHHHHLLLQHNHHQHRAHAHTTQPRPTGTSNYQMPSVPYGGLKETLGATAVADVNTQASSASSNPQITRVTYPGLAHSVRFPSTTARATQPLPKHDALPVPEQPGQSQGLGLDAPGGLGGCAGSRSSSSSISSCSSSSSISSRYSSSSNGGEAAGRKEPEQQQHQPLNSSSPTSSIVTNGNNEERCTAGDAEPHVWSSSLPVRPDSAQSHIIIINNNTDNTSSQSSITGNHGAGNSTRTSVLQEQSRTAHAAGDPSSYVPKTKNGSISDDCSGTTCTDAVPDLSRASSSPHGDTSTTVITKSSGGGVSVTNESTQDYPRVGMSILRQLMKEEGPGGDEEWSSPELKVDPVKIHLKRVRVNDAAAKSGSEAAHPESQPSAAETPVSPLSLCPPWGGQMTTGQVHLLRQAFLSSRWPSSQRYEELSAVTGLPKSEVARWFSDSRYVHKNGQLAWLEPEGARDQRAGGGAGNFDEALEDPATEQDTARFPGEEARGMAAWPDTYSSSLRALVGSDDPGKLGGAGESVQPEALQDPWSERVEGHQQPDTGQSFIEQQTDTSQTRDRLRMEMLEV